MSLVVWLPLNGDLHNQGLSSTTFSGTAAYKSYGKLGGQSLNLQNRITCSTPALNGVQFFSIAFWGRIEANPDSTANWMDVIGFTDQKSDNSTNGQFRFETGYGSDSSGGIHWHDNAINAIVDGANTYNTAAQRNEWHHIVVTVANDSIKSYYDGTLQRTHTTNLNKGHLTGSWWLGESTTRGCIQDVRIYDHALSPKEVEEIAKGLVLHYKLDNNGMGGDNLALNTRKLDIASSKANLNMYIRGAATRQLRADGFYESKGTASWQGLSFWANQLNLSVGTKVTYSFYIYGNGSSRAFSFYPMMYNSTGIRDTSTGLPISIDGGAYTIVNSKSFTRTTATSPEYHYVTFEWNQAVADIITSGGSIELSIQVHGTWNSGDWACIFAPKVEIGDKPTTWSPAKSELGDMATTVYDCSGYSHNGTIVGDLTAAAGSPRYGTATQFPGNALIEAEPLPIETKTISAWIKWNSLPSGYTMPLHDKNSGLAIGVYNGGTALISYIGTAAGGTGSKVSCSITTNTWYHIVVVKTGDTTRDVYINNVKQSPTTNNYWGGDMTKFHIGGRHISGSYSAYLNGQIVDVRAYATALSTQQIKELYNTSMSVDSNGNVYARELVEL